jgi:membrane-anchored protein YejM (alkaline phosphatase superfamily)
MKKIQPKKGRDIVFRQEEEDAFIFTPDNSAIMTLNETGALVWQMIEKGKGYDGALEALKEEYPQIEEAELKKDLDKFLEEIEKRELIER